MRKLVAISGALVMIILSSGTVMSQEATGACCNADGSCTVMTASECALAGGHIRGMVWYASPTPVIVAAPMEPR